MEERISIPLGNIDLEGILNIKDKEKSVIITHPHPLYGGDMYNNVVTAAVRAYSAKNYSTLRFNFRSVGNSTGSYEEGIGEQDDVKAAVSWLNQAGFGRTDLVGYSFGAWVLFQLVALNGYEEARDVVFISPPVDFLPFESRGTISCLKLVIVGDQDSFASVSAVQKQLSLWNNNACLEVLKGTDHFYATSSDTLIETLGKYLT